MLTVRGNPRLQAPTRMEVSDNPWFWSYGGHAMTPNAISMLPDNGGPSTLAGLGHHAGGFQGPSGVVAHQPDRYPSTFSTYHVDNPWGLGEVKTQTDSPGPGAVPVPNAAGIDVDQAVNWAKGAIRELAAIAAAAKAVGPPPVFWGFDISTAGYYEKFAPLQARIERIFGVYNEIATAPGGLLRQYVPELFDAVSAARHTAISEIIANSNGTRYEYNVWDNLQKVLTESPWLVFIPGLAIAKATGVWDYGGAVVVSIPEAVSDAWKQSGMSLPGIGAGLQNLVKYASIALAAWFGLQALGVAKGLSGK